MPAFPATVDCFGKEGHQLWGFKQLEAANKAHLRRKAMDLRDLIGAEKLPPMPNAQEAQIRWLIDVQVMLLNSLEGQGKYSSCDFGMPSNFAVPEQAYFGLGEPARAPAGQNAMAPRGEENPALAAAHSEAMAGAAAAKARNRGQGLW